MRARPAFLQIDGSKAGLSMDLPVFVYSHTKTSFKFLSRQGRYRAAFYVVIDLLLQITQREPYRALVCLDLSLSRSTDHRDCNLHSLSSEVRPTTLSFHLSVNMYVFNVKSYTECHKDKKGIQKAVTGLVSVPVSKTLV